MILIEGLPGTGKSTLANNLATLLREQGKEVKLYLETDEVSPFRYREGTQINTDIDDFESTVLSNWKKFLSSYDPNVITIQESLAIQQQLNFPLAIDQVERGEKIIAQIFELLKPFSTQVIYLHSQDPVAHFKQTMQSRGKEWVKTAVEVIEQAAWCKHRKLKSPESTNEFIRELSNRTEQVLEASPLPVHRFNINKVNYTEILHQITNSELL